MKTQTIHLNLSNSDRRRDALIAAGIAPSGFGQRRASRPHRDRKAAVARGERKHKNAWF